MPGDRPLLTYDDIPEPFHGHRTEPGPRYHRFAAGLLEQLKTSHGADGLNAGHRLVQSAWHLRYAGVGVEMHRIAPSISAKLSEDDQFVYLSGFQLAVTSSVAAIDLAAASLVYLTGHEQREPDLREMARRPALREGLSPEQLHWVRATNGDPDVTRFTNVRNALVHRHVPTSVTIRPGTIMLGPGRRPSHTTGLPPSYSIRVDEEDGEIPVDPSVAFAVGVDRFLALGLMLYDG